MVYYLGLWRQLVPGIVLLVIMLSSLNAMGATATTMQEKPIVVCTTSVLASIVKDLAGDMVEVEVIASPSICPAHYDIKPSDIEKIRHASLVLYHGMEAWVNNLVSAAGVDVPVVKIPGPWNTPAVLKDRYNAVARALEDNLGIDLSERLDKCLRAIDDTAEWLGDYAEKHGFSNTPVVVMAWQKPFVSFLGFKIVAVFKPPEMVSAKEYEEIISNATREGALLVIDNLQSGVELGRKIAGEIGAVEVALTNFPETAPGLNNMTEVMKYNAELLGTALGEAKMLRDYGLRVQSLEEKVSSYKSGLIVSVLVNIILLVIVIVQARRMRG